ncbi:MAG: VOC family protein [Filimonas sp.]|nr:VOC family protein [Filimonas sp.]
MKIPPTHQAVMPYLIIKNADQFASFTKEVFNAEQIFIRMRDDSNTIMHAEIKIGGCTIMYAASTEQYEPQTAGLFVYVEDADASYEKALTLGATAIMPPADQSYGRSCGITDPCGNTWWITSV